MKRLLPPILLALYVISGFALLTHMSKNTESVHVISQSSNYAIINVKDEAMAQEIIQALLNDKSRDPNAKTLIRMETGNPTRLQGPLKGNGSIHVINPHGIIVGANAIIELDDAPFLSTTDPPEGVIISPQKIDMVPSDSVELKAYGNVSALSINKEGKMRTHKKEFISTLDQPTPKSSQSRPLETEN